MHPSFASRGASPATPIWFATAATYAGVRQQLPSEARAFAEAAGFEPKGGRHLLLPAANGAIGGVLFGLEAAEQPRDVFSPGRLNGLLPPGTYRFANAPHDARLAALAFALGGYRFTRYRKGDDKSVRLGIAGRRRRRRSVPHRRRR